MAVTAYQLDRAERTKMYREMRSGVLIALPFERLTVDGNSYYEPGTSVVTVDSRGIFQRGVYVAQELYTHPAPALPPTTRPNQGQMAVWQYSGI